MNKIFVGTLFASLACGFVTIATAQEQLAEITVQAKRLLSTQQVGRTSSGVPIINISLSYGVSLKDLDVLTPDGMQAADKRINDAALSACQEIGRQYPDATPDDRACAKAAAKKASGELHKRAQAAKHT